MGKMNRPSVGLVFLIPILIFTFTGLIGKREEIQAISINQAINPTPTPFQPLKATPIPKFECELGSFPKRVKRWCEPITVYAKKYGLDPSLVAAVIWQESNGDPKAYSPSGAVGLMQVMPSDGIAAGFTCTNGPCFADRPVTKRLLDPEFNIKYGTRLLANLVEQNDGNLRKALMAYGPLDNSGYYANKVLSLYQKKGK